MNLTNLKRDLEKVRERLPKSEPEGPSLDYDLITPKEDDISNTIHLFHDIAVRLGHGTLSKCRYRIHFDQDPNFNEDARKEAIENARPEELERLGLELEILQKWMRLTPLLTDEEKTAIKQYNRLAGDYKYSQPPYSGTMVKAPDPDKLKEARLLYRQIMAKYDAKSYEDHPMKSYVAGSGIPIERLRAMDSYMADALEAKLK